MLDVLGLEYDSARSEWIKRDFSLSSSTQDIHSSVTRIVFAHRKIIKQNFSLQQLFTRLGFPTYLWSEACIEASGFAGCKTLSHQLPPASQYTASWYRFIIKQTGKNSSVYTWYEMTFLTFQSRDGAPLIYCLDVPDFFQDELLKKLQDQIAWCQPDYFSIQTLIMEQLLSMYDSAIWANRDLVRNIEKNRHESPSDADFAEMHDVLRHAIHTTEVLDVACEMCSKVIEQWKSCTQPAHINPIAVPTQDSLAELEWLPSLLKSFAHRSRSNESRLKNEINLALNLVAQEDSRATILISDATQKDSAAMKTVAFVTLAFLPATFVSTIFSMSFFNFSPGGNNGNSSSSSDQDSWRVSEQFWIYWVIAVPLTILTVAIWGAGDKMPNLRTGFRKTAREHTDIVPEPVRRRLTNLKEKGLHITNVKEKELQTV